MKLHLPYGLRKALLACLATIALPATLPSTLGTASGISAAFAAVAMLTPQQVAAAPDGITENEDDSITITKVNNGTQDQGGLNEAQKSTDYNVEGKEWKFSFDDGVWFHGDADVDGDAVKANITLEKTVTINNGSSGSTVTFSGKVSGNAGADFVFAGWSSEGDDVTFAFTGDISEFAGNFKVTGHHATFSFSNNTVGKVGSNSMITAENGGSLHLRLDGSTVNSGINVTDLTISGATTLNGTTTVNGATTFNSGAALTFGENTNVHLKSLTQGSTLTTLTLNGDSELGLETGGLSIGTLVLNGDNAGLAMDVTGGAHLTLSGFTDGGHTLTIYLTGLTEALVGTDGYDIFGGVWDSAWAGKITVVGDGRAVELDESGKVVWAADKGSVTWTATDAANTLTWENGGSGWDGQKTFNNGDDVTLSGSGSTALQVTVSGDIFTGNLTISGDTTGGFVLAAAAEGGSLTIGGNLKISANTTLNVSNNAALNLDVAAGGSVTLDSATLTICAANNQRYTVNAANIFHGTGESLTIEGTGTFKIDLSGAANSATFDAAGLFFSEDIVVECDGNAGWSNFKNLNVLGTLKLTGHEIVLQGTNSISGTVDTTGLTQDQGHITFDKGNVSTTFTNKLTMATAGLDVRAGKVILEQGANVKYLSMNGGTLNVTADGITTTGDMSLVSGNSTSGGQITVTDGGVHVGGAYTQDTGSLTVTAGGMGVTGNLTLKNSDLTVEAGDVSVGGDLVITKEGDNAHSTFTVSQGDLEVTGALQLNHGGAVLNVTNGTLRLRKGLATTQYTPQVNAHAVEFLNEEEADYDGNLKATDVTKDGAGTQHLHSGQTGYFDISGNVTVKNGTLKVSTGTAASHVDGVLQVEGGTFLWDASGGATMTVGSVYQTGGILTVSGNMNVTGDVSIAQGATSFSVTGKTLNIGGHLSAGSGSITLGAGGKLVLQSGTATDNSLGTLTLDGDATLGFSLVDGNFSALTLGTLTLDGRTLTLDLGPGLAQYLAQHNGTATLDLFAGNAANTLKQAKEDGLLTLAETYGYTWDVNDRGQLTFTAPTEVRVWSEANHTGNLTLVWENGQTDGRWDNSENFTAWNKVELTGSTEAVKTITLKGGAIQANSVTISGGTGKFVFGSEGNGSLEATDITVGVNTDFNAKVSVVSSLTVQDGVTVNVGDTGSLRMQDGASITVGKDSNLVIAADKLSHEGDVLQFTYSGGETGSGEVEIKLGNNKRIIGLNAAKGVTLKLTNTGEGWSYFQDITSAGEVIVAGNQVILDGTNNLVNLSDGGTALTSRLVLNDSHVSTTLSGDLNLSVSALDVRKGELVVQNGTITVGKGLFSNQPRDTDAHIKGKNLDTTVAENDTKTYYGALTLSGSLTKKGAGTQVLIGGNNNELSVTGTVTVEAGALNWGKADLESSMGSLTVSGGTFKLLGGTLTVGSITSMTAGTLQVGSGTLVLTDAGGSTLNNLALGEGATAGNLTVNAGSFTISGGWTWTEGSSLTLGGSLQTITLSGEGWTEYLSNALSGAGNQKLTVTLGNNFLRGARGKSFTLFTGGGVADFTQYFNVDVGALSATYQGLKFNADGKLSWEKVVGPVEPGPGEDVYWGGGENESELTWGSTGDDGEFDTEPDGSGEKQVWMPGDHVHFLGDSSHTVNLADDITTGTFGAEGSSPDKHATYTFQSDKDGTPRGLIVGKDMSVKHAELTFTKDVNLTVKGSVTLTDSTVSVEGKAEFGGEVSGTGILDTGKDGRISLNRTGEGGFKGEVTGTGTLATAARGQVTLVGDVSGFGGTLDVGPNGTLTLSGDAVGDEVSVKAGGSGTLAVNGGEADVTFSGTVGGAVSGTGLTLKNAGSGELTVTSQVEGNGNGAKLDGGKGGITLGGSGNVAAWNGREVTGGDITLSNVTLAEGGLEKTASGAKVYVDTALAAEVNTVARAATSQGGIVDVKGMAADVLDGIKVNAHGQLTGVTGTYKVGANRQLTLHFTAENVVGSGAEKGLIVGDEKKGFSVEFSGRGEASEQGLLLEFDEAAIIEALREVGEGEALYLRALENGTWDAKEKGVTIDWTKLGLMDIYVTGVEFTDVGLKIAGSTRDLYVVLDGKESDSHESKAPADLEEKLATVVMAGQTLTLNWAKDGTVRNLLGEEGTKLDIKGASGQGLTVTLDNTHYDKLSDDRYQEEDLPKPEDTTVHGQDTVFLGSINGGKGVDIVKSGLGTLTVGGDYTLADGDTRLEAGALSLSGAGNRMKSLTFAYAAAPSAEEERGLLLDAGSRTEVGGIVEDPKAGSSVGNEVKLTGNAELTLTGESTLADTAISSDEAHGGVLRLAEGASLSFTGDKGIVDTAVDMKNAVLDLGASKSALTKLDGSGTLKSAAGGEVTVGGGSFTGTLGSSAEGVGAGTLVVTGEFTLDKVASAGDAKMGVRLEGQSHLTVKVGEKQGDGTDMLNFGDIELGGGQLTVDFGGRGINRNYVTGNVIGVGEGGVLEFVSNGTVKDDTIHTGFTVAAGLQGQEELEKFVKFSGVDNLLNDHTVGVTEEGEVVLTLQAVEENRLAELIPGAQKNGLAGAEMMWGSLKGRSQGELLSDIFARPDSAYARLAFYLSQCYDGGADATGLDRTLAAAAGSAISTLGAALGQDVHRQLSTIRNRTTGMGGAAHAADERLPQWHAWIQGEGNYHKLDADGLAPGYTLNSWGGTVGVDADVTRRMTLGLAVTAMYGDLKPDSPDSATGDLDTAYLSAFARVAHGAWIHTFAVSGGFADVKLDRTVSYNGGSYRTSGSTDGYALGVLYEVGYTRLMNAAGTVALQPVFNVEWRHASIDGYTESGSDAGVSTDDITQDVVTFGAGARAQFAVGANVFNHAAVLETRALVKADVGDRSGTASNAIVGDTARAEVESAEVGAVGVELGAGLSIPIGTDTGSIFVDGSVEFRSGWTSANATVGYRMNF